MTTMPVAMGPLLVLVLTFNFFVLGSSRLSAVVRASAAQGVVLGVLVGVAHRGGGWPTGLVVAAVVLIKGVGIPMLLLRALRDAAIRREIEPVIGFIASLLLGALGTAACLVFARTLPLLPEHQGTLIVPTSLATVLTGFLVLTTRRKAITQVVGYLVLENGIFVMGLALLEAVPFLVEIGILLDLFVGIFVMGIIIHHINREFSSLDTARLTALKE